MSQVKADDKEATINPTDYVTTNEIRQIEWTSETNYPEIETSKCHTHLTLGTDHLVSLCNNSGDAGKNNLIVTEMFKQMDDVSRKYLLLNGGIKFKDKNNVERTYNCFSMFPVTFDQNNFIREHEIRGFGLICKKSESNLQDRVLVAIYNLHIKDDGHLSAVEFVNDGFGERLLSANTQGIYVSVKNTEFKFASSESQSTFVKNMVGSILIHSDIISDGFYLIRIVLNMSDPNSPLLSTKFGHFQNIEYNSLLRLQDCYSVKSTEQVPSTITNIKNGLMIDSYIHFLVTKVKDNSKQRINVISDKLYYISESIVSFGLQ